jgi:hypothetical protein
VLHAAAGRGDALDRERERQREQQCRDDVSRPHAAMLPDDQLKVAPRAADVVTVPLPAFTVDPRLGRTLR